MYLLDTPVITELRKAKSARCDDNVMRWAAGVARQNMYMSAIGLLELENSVVKIERKDRSQGAPLRTWLDEQVMKAFEGRILAIDAAVVKRRAALPEYTSDRDALLAATAQVHGLTLVTRNVTVFKTTKIKLFNPWGYAPTEDTAGDDADWQQVAKTGSQWLKSLFLR